MSELQVKRLNIGYFKGVLLIYITRKKLPHDFWSMRDQKNSKEFCAFHQNWLEVYTDRDKFFHTVQTRYWLEDRVKSLKNELDVVVSSPNKSIFYNYWMELYDRNDQNWQAEELNEYEEIMNKAGYFGPSGGALIRRAILDMYRGDPQGMTRLPHIRHTMGSFNFLSLVLQPEVVCKLIQQDVKKVYPTIEVSLKDACIIKKDSSIYGDIMF